MWIVYGYNIYNYCSPVDTSSNADGIINSLNKVLLLLLLLCRVEKAGIGRSK